MNTKYKEELSADDQMQQTLSHGPDEPSILQSRPVDRNATGNGKRQAKPHTTTEKSQKKQRKLAPRPGSSSPPPPAMYIQKRSIKPSATPQQPRVLSAVSTEDFITAIGAMKFPQLLLMMAKKGTAEATRNVASNEACLYRMKLPKGLCPPQVGTETYITANDGYKTGLGGKKHSENEGMVDDWCGFYKAMSVLLADPQVRSIWESAYGKDFRVLPGRGYYRQAVLRKDLTKTREQLLVHKDYPKWVRCHDEDAEPIEIVTAKCSADELGWILLDQAEFHGIPKGGQCVGWSPTVVSSEKYEEYLVKVDGRMKKLRSKNTSTISHDPSAHQDITFVAKDALLMDFVKGSRTHLYASGKVVQAPHGMAARHFPIRQHRYLTPAAFACIRPDAPRCDSIATCMTRLAARGLDFPFQKVAKACDTWNVDPSSFSNDALARFFGIFPDNGASGN